MELLVEGPCDRLGGVTKRMADNAIKQRRYVIQDAFDFFSWAESTQLSSKILYKFISSKDVALCAEELKLMNPSPIHGSMKLHVVVVSVDGINYRNTFCYCVNCFKNGVFTYNCEGWKSFPHSRISESAPTVTECASTASSLIEYALRDFVRTIYEVDHLVYTGTVVEIDEPNNEVLAFFMEPSVVFKSNSQTCCWPKKPDEIWLKNSPVLCLISPPRETK